MTRFLFAIFLVGSLLSACTGMGSNPSADTFDDVTYQVFFGRNIGNDGDKVSDADWRGFESKVIFKNLPGYTLVDGAGGFIPKGKQDLAHEDTNVLIFVARGGSAVGPRQYDCAGTLVHKDEETAPKGDAIEFIVSCYIAAFDQESVLVIANPSQARFQKK